MLNDRRRWDDMEYKVRTTKVTITPGELFSEDAFEVEVVDEGGGEFITIRDLSSGKDIRLDPGVWELVKKMTDTLFEEIKRYET